MGKKHRGHAYETNDYRKWEDLPLEIKALHKREFTSTVRSEIRVRNVFGEFKERLYIIIGTLTYQQTTIYTESKEEGWKKLE